MAIKTRTIETQWAGPITIRMALSAPFLLIATPLMMAGNGLLLISACIAGKDISYSWETDVEPRTAPNPKADVAPASGAHVQRVVGQTGERGVK